MVDMNYIQKLLVQIVNKSEKDTFRINNCYA